MSFDLSDQLDSVKLNDDRVRLSASASTPTSTTNPNSSNRRIYGAAGHQRRQNLHNKRSATIDPESIDERLRIVVLGATKVGKTCLCQQFLQQKFLIDHKETVDEMYRVELPLLDRHIILEILDTAGIDEFPVMRRIAIAHGDAFLIVYAIDDASSFAMAEKLRQLVLEIKGDIHHSSVPILIVGNKCDVDSHLREVPRDYAEIVVRQKWSTILVETTCHDRDAVLAVFDQLLRMANIHMTLNADVIRRSSDPNLSAHKESRHHSKRQSCAQQ